MYPSKLVSLGSARHHPLISHLLSLIVHGLLLSALLVPGRSSAQSASLLVDPLPSPYVSDWEVQPGIFSLTVTNGPDAQELVILIAIRDSRGTSVVSAETHPQPFAANELGVYTSASEIGGSFDYDTAYEDELIRTGRLPEGDFSACVTVEDFSGSVVVPEQCVPFSIYLPDPPFLLSPADGATIASDYPTFEWTPIQLPIGVDVRYTLQVAEVRDRQQPFEALTSNILHNEEEDIMLESLPWPLTAQPLEPGARYAWWVLALDPNGVALTANQGRSEVRMFTVEDEDSELFPSGDPQSLQVMSADQATGPLADFDTRDFESTAAELERLAANGSAIILPFALSADFPTIEINGIRVYVDRQLKSIAIRGSKIIRGRTYDVMFSSFWGTRRDPRSKALAIKGPSFDGFFPAGGLLDSLGTSTAWMIVAGGGYKIKSDELPPDVEDYYGDNDIDVRLGLNLFSKIDIRNSNWLADVARALDIPDPYIELQGFLGPAISAAFSSSGDSKVTIGAETSLSAAIPLWIPERFRGVITEMKGQLEIGLAVERESAINTDTTKTETQPKASAQVSLETKVALPFLAAAERLPDELQFTGAVTVEKSPGEKAQIALSLSARDLLKLPAFENVFSVHDPKVTVTFARDEARTHSLAFTARVDVGRYRNFGSIKVERKAQYTSVADTASASSDQESPPSGGVPTPFKQAELLAKQQEREAAAKQKPKSEWNGKWAASVTVDPTALGAIRPRELLADLFNFAGNLELLPDGPQLVSLGMSFLPDTPGSMVISGSAMIQDMPTHFIASRMQTRSGNTGMLFGVAPHGWSFGEAFPDVDIPLLSDVDLSNVGLLFSSEEFTTSSDDIYGEEYGFYSALYGRDEFDVVIKPGINLIATLPVDGMDPESPLIPLMEKLGVQRGPALLQGAISRQVRDIYLRASLPPLSPPGAPEWFEYGQLDVELTGQPSIGLVGSIAVNLEDDTVVFFVRTSAGRQGLILSGGLDAPEGWHEPFGIEWMTLNRTVLLLGLTPTGSVQLGFEGDLVVGEKDVRVAVLTALNAATGVPTNFMFDGESEAGVGISDLVTLQARIAAVNSGGEPNPLPVDRLPPLGIEDLKLKFAPKDSPELNIERGLAIGGMLGMQPAPDEPLDLIAMADFDVSDNGVIARAAVGDFEIGPVSLTDAALDLTLTRDDQYFRLSGDADLTIMDAEIDVDFARTEMTFDASGQAFGLFEADVNAVGRANLSEPQFTVVGTLKNDFAEVMTSEMVDAVIDAAAAAMADAERARAASITAHQRAQSAAAAARGAWLRAPVFPRAAKTAARARYVGAARVASIRFVQRTVSAAVYAKWVGFHSGLVALRGAADASPIRVTSARFDGDLARMGDGQVARLQVTVEIDGAEITVTNEGFNFRERGPGVVSIARQVVRQAFDRR